MGGPSTSASFAPANDDKFFIGIMSGSDLKRVGMAGGTGKNKGVHFAFLLLFGSKEDKYLV